MTPALKLDIFFAFPSYGGNGGIASEHPDIREWFVELILQIKQDPRIGKVAYKTLNDTPITMVRNDFVVRARDEGCHLVVMVDSDQNPNLWKNIPGCKAFFWEAFNAVYEHYQKGPLVIGAPYCGTPGAGENVYVFQFDNMGERGEETRVSLDQFTRVEASKMAGIQEVAALPTGLIMYDMRAFELIEPSGLSKRQVLERLIEGKFTLDEAELALHEGWFYYEWVDSRAHKKASTEDVTNTRDIALAGVAKLGYNPLRCAWDSWIGHHKPYCVGKPVVTTVEQIGANFKKAVLEDRRGNVKQLELDLTAGLPRKGA